MRIKPEIRSALLTLLLLALALVALWVWIGIRVGIWTYPQYDRHLWLIETDPIAHEFWAGHIRAGDNVDALTNNWPPDQTMGHGRWAEAWWRPGDHGGISFIGVGAIAKDGVLVEAAAYSDDRLNNRVFFSTWTTNDQADFEKASAEYNETRFARFDAENAVLATNFPIFAALSCETITNGSDVQDVTNRWPPDLITQFQPWTVLTWFPKTSSATLLHVVAVRIVAKNGVVVHATTIHDNGENFDEIYFESPQDEKDFDSAYEKWEKGLVAGQRRPSVPR